MCFLNSFYSDFVEVVLAFFLTTSILKDPLFAILKPYNFSFII